MKKISILFVLGLFLMGCYGFRPCPLVFCSPTSVYENNPTIHIQVTDKESGLPVKDAAIIMTIVKVYWSDNLANECCDDRWVQKVFTGLTDANGQCETTFTASYRVTDDHYELNYAVSKLQFEKVTGSIDLKRDAERTIEVRILNNTTQP